MSHTNGKPFSVESSERPWESVSNEELNSRLRSFLDRKQTVRSPQGNLTSRWLAKNGGATRAMLIEHLSRKLPTSRRLSVIEDHVQTFLCRLVEKDILAPFLSAGKNIQPSVLRVWCYQSACTEMRGWGVDASLRQSRGAKTHRDRMVDAGKLPPSVVQSTETVRVVERRFEVENGEVVYDLHDPSSRTAEDSLLSSEALSAALDFLRQEGGSKKGLSNLLETVGLSGPLRAELSNLSRARAETIMGRIREFLREESLL